MSYEIKLDYFHGNDSNRLAYVRLPKIMFTDPFFAKLSNDARVLYSLFVDRIGLSVRNGWIDEKKRVYIYFSVEDVARELHVGETKARKTIRELDSETGIGLIERKNQGLGKPALIYVKNFFLVKNGDEDTVDNSGSDRYISTVRTSEIYGPVAVECNGTDPRNVTPNNTEYSNTELNNIESNHISSAMTADEKGNDKKSASEAMKKYKEYREIIEVNIGYDYLAEQYDKELVDGIVELMLEVVMSQNEYIVISSNYFPTDIVRSRFLKLNMSHIEYVIHCLKKVDTDIYNMKKYMLATLYNAPMTISSYYSNWLNSDNRKRALGE